MDLEQKIEALLFWKAESISLKKLSSLIGASEEEIKNAISNLKNSLEKRGICILENGDEYVLGTNPSLKNWFDELTKEEFNRDIGKAGMETLSIIMYQGPISRKEIDYIRGVNSGFVIRNLMIRGLVEKIEDPKDGRAFLYKPTFELLSFMGISNIEDLPNFENVKKEIESFKGSKEVKDQENTKLSPDLSDSNITEDDGQSGTDE